MKVKIFYLALLIGAVFSLSMGSLYAQGDVSKEIFVYFKSGEDTDSLHLPRFDVHVGYGFVSGGRVGTHIRFARRFSLEVSYGYDWRNFIALSNIEQRYGIGVSWLPWGERKLALSFLIVSRRRPYNPAGTTIGVPDNSVFHNFLISLNIGNIPSRATGVNILWRIGTSSRLWYNPLNKKYHLSLFSDDFFGVNLDVMVSYSFRLGPVNN